ncbi:sensor histidine kinase NtrY-like [Candidatus Pelagibacter sp. RS39]|uniref:sensor histidine kinase NtrY-like n=1 Tax=Candidatus Pelagibacter sp. RS39 TaxID=1977864 RepID=UPI000A163318|nr:ATP-binding protein [Candidatus Pelagibacter sp. RS39]ARJ47814.1 two-component sensor histidine kinase [Candidatus Pelagibacter sp. RS39]
MVEFLKKNIFIIFLSSITLFLGFLTFLTFIDRSFIELNQDNLQYLLLVNILLLLLLFAFIFFEVKKSIRNDIDKDGLKSNKKYITYFSLFTLIPSILISIFSLFLFSFALEKYFDKKVTTVVNNSYELAKSYVEEVRNKIESDIILIAFDTNKSSKFLNDNKNEYIRFLKTQRLIRDIDEIHIIDQNKKLLFTNLDDRTKYIPPIDKTLKLVLDDDRPLKIINAPENISAAIIRLQAFENRFLYIVKYLDKDISKYLNESQEAINFYYTVEERSTGIKISFAIIYIIIVTLLLFISITIAIRFSSRFFRSINNLISASTAIGEGDLTTKVPEIKTDKDLEILNKNFNSMIVRLKNQQDKLIINERYEAWGNLARKLAHEIKNPLTPIQLSIDRIKEKYIHQVDKNEKNNFEENLKIINNQIKQIGNLVNEFSDFARMPKPVLKKNDLIKIIHENIKLLSEIDSSITISLDNKKPSILLKCDKEQISRVIFNLIKNSVESIQQKAENTSNFDKIITIEIFERNNQIYIIIKDSGLGFENIKNNIKDILNPYFTTKKNGTGLGLSIVNKIINDHNGEINFVSIPNGAKIEIIFN